MVAGAARQGATHMAVRPHQPRWEPAPVLQGKGGRHMGEFNNQLPTRATAIHCLSTRHNTTIYTAIYKTAALTFNSAQRTKEALRLQHLPASDASAAAAGLVKLLVSAAAGSEQERAGRKTGRVSQADGPEGGRTSRRGVAWRGWRARQEARALKVGTCC